MVPREWRVEVEAEVETWLSGLAAADFRVGAGHRPARRAGRGSADAALPQPRLGLKELRFDCGGGARPITYWIDAERRISLLTTFRKQRDNERTEVSRARAAMARCIAERHTAEEGS